MKLLLHTCCGPCFLGVWEELKLKDFEVVNYFYNPNIQPKEEYFKRLENLKKATKGKTKDIIEERYLEAEHHEAIKGLEGKFPERCLKCYSLRLNQTAKRAKNEGFEFFSTTLLVSPYQQHDELKKIGEKVAKSFGVKFLYIDFRSYFREGQEIAKDLNIYRQKYCGCLLSKNESGR